ncbi:MAG: AmmeMemoRadiSam system protein B [Candidatus Tectomicrobia bacterium]|uniref:AmmeMemoRadiSam system protein B n=1 Tax=Tectimicrobiota bacterium TaxID=2528274 RepID=A0A932GQC2_UNCTE|nr:AmmeMemoRadiSam system protein B [Candidatus Tectomicrobia bacterium]
MDYPKLRNVEAFPVNLNGQHLVCLRDPYNFSEKLLFLPLPAFFVVSLLDGQHSLLDIQEAFLRRYGEILFGENIEQLLRELEGNFLLEGPVFQQRKQQVEGEFRCSNLRLASHAGQSYPGDAGEIRKQLGSFFTDQRGPGLPGPATQEPPLRGLISPHIDLRSGGPCYAWGYRRMAEHRSTDLFVILGTGHSLSFPFALTRKDFESPLGVAETDQAFVDRLAESGGENLFAGEFVHRAEHTIEFQLLFLQYLFGGRDRFRIVPILCGSFHSFLDSSQSPGSDPAVGRFLGALAREVANYSGKVCVIASADLSHVGPRYGDLEPPSPRFLEEVEREDRRLLARAEQGDAEGFFDCTRQVQDRYRVCGVSAIYSMLKVLGEVRGRLLRYDRSAVDQENSTVSYASMAFD